jgi:hypothetical protein
MVLMNLDIDEAFARHLDVTRFSRNTRIAPVMFFCNQANAMQLDNKIINFVVLNVTAGNGLKGLGNIRMQSTSSFGAKRTKNMRDVSYNRYWICADLTNPPFCFAIITRTSQETSDLLRYTNGEVFVGSNYFIYEPSITLQTVGSTPVLASIDHKVFLPARPFTRLPSTLQHMKEPATAGDIKYFILNEKSITLQRIRPAQCVSCCGIQCDRQKKKAMCTCLHLTNFTSLVYEFDVSFTVPPAFDDQEMITIHSFRSLRTTRIFFFNFEDQVSTVPDDLQLNLQNIHREKISAMVTFVNQVDHGGWTIVGWFMKGSTTDAATDNERIDNDTFQVHLSYLFPTHYVERIKNNPDFHGMLIHPSTAHVNPPHGVLPQPPPPAAAAAAAAAAP